TESYLRRCRVKQTGYGITDTWDEIVDTLMEITPTTLEGVDQRVTELDTTIRQRTDEFEAGSEDRSAAIAAHVRILEAHVAALIALTSSLQTQLTTSLRRIKILEARDPEPQEGPAEAGNICYSTDTGAPLGYKVAEIRMRALLPSTSRKTDIPEADVPPRKRA
nr:hypothetical protein [Tanacetum cinerariifolium]